MAKFKPCNDNQMVMLPISLRNQLAPGSLAHTISELVEKHIDLLVFDGRKTGLLSVCQTFRPAKNGLSAVSARRFTC
jgi:hypothetical protein